MNRAGRFPPGISGVERLLKTVANLRGDCAGNNECHDAIGVKMRWRTCSRRIRDLNEAEVKWWFAREFLLDHVAPRRRARRHPRLRGGRAVRGRCNSS